MAVSRGPGDLLEGEPEHWIGLPFQLRIPIGRGKTALRTVRPCANGTDLHLNGTIHYVDTTTGERLGFCGTGWFRENAVPRETAMTERERMLHEEVDSLVCALFDLQAIVRRTAETQAAMPSLEGSEVPAGGTVRDHYAHLAWTSEPILRGTGPNDLVPTADGGRVHPDVEVSDEPLADSCETIIAALQQATALIQGGTSIPPGASALYAHAVEHVNACYEAVFRYETFRLASKGRRR